MVGTLRRERAATDNDSDWLASQTFTRLVGLGFGGFGQVLVITPEEFAGGPIRRRPGSGWWDDAMARE